MKYDYHILKQYGVFSHNEVSEIISFYFNKCILEFITVATSPSSQKVVFHPITSAGRAEH